ncbi:MAG: hypothetical protein MZV65_16415 [Chromatiales bacterium]|nr:hypothetical protein [Chromatiales bacterium]
MYGSEALDAPRLATITLRDNEPTPADDPLPHNDKATEDQAPALVAEVERDRVS